MNCKKEENSTSHITQSKHQELTWKVCY